MTPAERARQIDREEFAAECAAARERALAYAEHRRQIEADKARAWMQSEQPTVVKVFTYPGRQAKPHTLNGVSKTISQWAALHGLKEHTLAQRLRKGMTLADALTVPVRQRVAKAPVPISPDQPPKQPKPRPGVVFDFGAFEGTGAGSAAQETPNLEFSKEAAE